MVKPLVIEIGVEELPAIPFLKELPHIEKKWADILELNSLLCEFDFFYTPRRLVLWHREFPKKQPDFTEEMYGAPVDIAFKDGKPTPAALGFAKKCGVALEEIGRTQKNSKEVLYFKKETEGQSSTQLISLMVNEFLKKLHFGKSMRWGENQESFIRPIRWIGCMMGDEHIPFEAYGVKSTYFSYPHRSISYEPFAYDFAGNFFCKLDKNGVILYQDERAKKIEKEFEDIEKKEGIRIQKDEELFDEVVAITEYPKALMGSFDEEFLRLPPEVIITSMKEHQRYFPVFKEDKLTNRFIVVSNAICDDYGLVIKGNEKVLKARLSDALFFYENDLKNGLNYEGLKDIVFLENLGSLLDKTNREKSIADLLFGKYSDQVSSEFKDKSKEQINDLLSRAVMYTKADLLTEMVYEFTELQGLMGYYYAKAANEENELAIAIKEQYLPNSEESDLPSSIFSSIVALSCKLDSLSALFSIGKIPTGTKDPYALRRAVNGIIKIVLAQGLDFDIKQMIKDISKSYDDFDKTRLEEFFLERIYQFFDANPSVVKAVLESKERDICEISRKIEALKNIVQSSGFKEVFTTFKRVANIVKDIDTEEQLNIDETLFESEHEKALYGIFNETNSKEYLNYEAKLDALFGLKDKIDSFFDNVMVNVENKKIKNNRKNLIATIYKAFKEIADIKEISV